MKFNLEGKIPAGAGRLLLILALALIGFEGGAILGLV